MQLKPTLILALVASSFAAPVALAADSSTASASDRVVITQVNGRPPFKRQRISAEQASLARFEESKPVTSRADFRGPPPFSRHGTRSRASADFARFEESAGDSTKARRIVGPPGKPATRRHR